MIQFENMLPETPAAQPDSIASGSHFLESFKGLSFDDAISKMANGIIDFAFRLFIAILIFYLGKFIIKRIYKTVHNVMVARKIDVSLITFILSLVKITLYFILIVTIIGILGIETSSFLALFASAGVAIGMALSGTLQNFAGGVLILLLKPYKVGDFIEAQGYTGFVKAIQIFHTVINTTDNKAIIIPNGVLSTSSINNFSLESYRRVDWTVSLAYGTDLEKACEALRSIVASDPRIVQQYVENDKSKTSEETDAKTKSELEGQTEKRLSWWKRRKLRKKLAREVRLNETEEMAGECTTMSRTDCSPFAELQEMGESSINIAVRAWTESQNYWNVFFEMNKKFYIELPKMGFEFPFPQMDVHINPNTPS